MDRVILEPSFGEDSPDLYVSWYLLASYIYYNLPHWEPPMKDEHFDKMCKVLLGEFENLNHPHKHLLSKESLRAGTGFNLREEDYPLIVKHAAIGLYKR